MNFERPVRVSLRERRLNDRIFDDVFAVDELHGSHVVAVQNPQILIETAAHGIELLLRVAQVPFADHAGGITGLPKQLGERDFAMSGNPSSAVLAAEIGSGVRRQTATKRIASRHQRRPRRCAKWCRRVELSEPRTFGGHSVQIWSFEFRMAIARQVAVTEVVSKDNNDILAVLDVGCVRFTVRRQPQAGGERKPLKDTTGKRPIQFGDATFVMVQIPLLSSELEQY